MGEVSTTGVQWIAPFQVVRLLARGRQAVRFLGESPRSSSTGLLTSRAPNLPALRELIMNTTAIPVSRLPLLSRPRWMSRLPDFVALMKRRVMALAVFTALVGLIVAPGRLSPTLGGIAILAIAAGAA